MRRMSFPFLAVILAVALGATALFGYLVLGWGRTAEARSMRVALGSAAITADVANTMALRTQGLSGRTSLAPDHGMIFLFGWPSIQVFWMKDMNFPIDIIWVRGGKITGVAKDAVPEPGKSLLQLTLYKSPGLVDTVVEVPAGSSDRWGLKVGDHVTYSN